MSLIITDDPKHHKEHLQQCRIGMRDMMATFDAAYFRRMPLCAPLGVQDAPAGVDGAMLLLSFVGISGPHIHHGQSAAGMETREYLAFGEAVTEEFEKRLHAVYAATLMQMRNIGVVPIPEFLLAHYCQLGYRLPEQPGRIVRPGLVLPRV